MAGRAGAGPGDAPYGCQDRSLVTVVTVAAALTEVTGDFVEAVRLSSEVLASKGRIYPATINDVRLVAELEDGTKVLGFQCEAYATTSAKDITQLGGWRAYLAVQTAST